MVNVKEAVPIVSAIIFAAILIIIGMLVFYNIGETSIQMFDCSVVTNESMTASNVSAARFANPGPLCTLDKVYNLTNAVIFTGTNYTVDMTSATLLWNVGPDNGTLLSLNYSYYNRGLEHYQFLNSSVNAFSGWATWWPLIILAFMIGIVLWYIVRSLGMRAPS